jgi:hypothetical protein
MQYSNLALSRESDFFPALIGIAKQVSEVRRSRYLAGMWENSLNDDLLWRGHGWDASRPLKWRAPSWSWASTKADIYYGDAPLYWDADRSLDERENDYKHFSTVVSCECIPAGLDEFGELKSGKLQLSGLCLDATLNYDSATRTKMHGLPIFTGMEVSFDIREIYPQAQIRYQVVLQDGKTMEMWPDYDISLSLSGPNYVPPRTRVICIRMSWVQKNNSAFICGQLFSLVLRQVDLDSQRFTRIGLLVLEDGKDDTSIYENAKCRVVDII